MHGAALFANVRLGVAELLLAKGADINATDNKGETPLRIARLYNETKFSNWFVQHGAHL